MNFILNRTWRVLVLTILTAPGFSQNIQKLYREAETAYRGKDYKLFYEKIKAANVIHPYHQGVLYQLGMAEALIGKKAEAIQHLKQAILINADFKLEGVQDFKSLYETRDWNNLIALQKEWQATVINSSVALILKDRQLHAEGIAYDEVSKFFYIGSIHKRKIIRVSAAGEVTDFCPPGIEGMTSVFGLKVDNTHGLLWACSSPMNEMENYDSLGRSILFKFDLNTGKLLSKYQIPTVHQNSIFGDLVLNQKGQPFLSDSKNNIIWTLNEKTNRLETFYSSDEFWNIQGLAFTFNDKFIIVADYVRGLWKLDMSSKVLTPITTTLDVSLKGIDGIYFYKNSLIAIQNGVSPLRATRYWLDPKQNQITDFEIIDKNHPDFNEPTLGVLVGNSFYYIANSQWGGYQSNSSIKPSDQLKDIVILKNEIAERSSLKK